MDVNISELENNLLYEDISQNNCGIVDEIFKHLLKNDIITEKELANIFEQHNLYIVGFRQNGTTAENDVSKMIKAINSAYRVSRVNFIWKMKMQENKKKCIFSIRRCIRSNITNGRRYKTRKSRTI